MRNLITKIQQFAANRVEQHGAQYTLFGIIGIIIFPLFYYISQHYASHNAGNFYFRIIATLLCLPLAASTYWPSNWRKWLPTYWYLSLLYCLPFLFTVLLLENRTSNPAWVISLPFILLWLMILVDGLSFIVLFTVGTILGFIFADFMMDVPISSGDYFVILCQYGIFVAMTMYLLYNKERSKEEQDKTLAIKPIAAGIAHELRTPLASINAGAGGVKQYLPTLLDAYQQAKNNNLPVGVIREIHFKQLNETLDKVIRETHYANTIIDMMLMQVNQSAINPHIFQVNSMQDCLAEALDRYPFIADCRKKLVEWDKNNDFSFHGDKLLFTHMIFNLLKNAIYFIAEADKGKIYIWLESGKKFNTLHFKDTGTGIAENIKANMFKNFYTTTPNGSGIGLAFCKTVMESMQGKISCESSIGEYTEFILEFPKYENE